MDSFIIYKPTISLCDKNQLVLVVLVKVSEQPSAIWKGVVIKNTLQALSQQSVQFFVVKANNIFLHDEENVVTAMDQCSVENNLL